MEHAEQFKAFLVEGAIQLGIPLLEKQVDEFTTHYKELLAWNKKINLTAIRGTKEIAVKHFLDSIICSRALQPLSAEPSLLDVGSGPGFPGLPLKVLHPQLALTLLEPDQKKTAFLRQVVGKLNLKNTVVVSKTIQEFSREVENKFSYVVIRALKLGPILHCIPPLLAAQGKLILFRTKPFDLEIEINGLQVAEEIAYDLPYSYGKRVLTIMRLVESVGPL